MKDEKTPINGFVTRFAPSPNGWLHLGHAYSALIGARARARRAGNFFCVLKILISDARGRILSKAFIKTLNGWG